MSDAERYWKKKLGWLRDFSFDLVGEVPTPTVAVSAKLVRLKAPRCTIKGCKRAAEIRGACRPHYQNARRAAKRLLKAKSLKGVAVRPFDGGYEVLPKDRMPKAVGVSICASCRRTRPCFKRGRRVVCRDCVRDEMELRTWQR